MPYKEIIKQSWTALFWTKYLKFVLEIYIFYINFIGIYTRLPFPIISSVAIFYLVGHVEFWIIYDKVDYQKWNTTYN